MNEEVLRKRCLSMQRVHPTLPLRPSAWSAPYRLHARNFIQPFQSRWQCRSKQGNSQSVYRRPGALGMFTFLNEVHSMRVRLWGAPTWRTALNSLCMSTSMAGHPTYLCPSDGIAPHLSLPFAHLFGFRQRNGDARHFLSLAPDLVLPIGLF